MIKLGRRTIILLHESTSKTNHKRVSSHSRTPLVLGQATSNLDSLDSSRLGLGGSNHLSPYNILCSFPPRLHPNGTFFPGLPKWSPEIVLIYTTGTLGIHNFLFKPSSGMRSKAIWYFSLRAFQHHVTLLLQTSRTGRFLTFNGQESNCQFDSQPFFCP
jgi:hypothetical protein